MKETLAVRQCLQFNFESDMKPLLKFPRVILRLLIATGLVATMSGFSQTQTNVTLAWNPSTVTGIAGYNVYSGIVSQTYTNIVSLGNVTNVLVAGLNPGTTYYFSVTAVDASGLESPHSNETSYSVPVNITTTSSNSPPIISNTP